MKLNNKNEKYKNAYQGTSFPVKGSLITQNIRRIYTNRL